MVRHRSDELDPLIKTAAAEVRGEGAAGEITFVEWWMGVCHMHILVLQTVLSNKSRLCVRMHLSSRREMWAINLLVRRV